MIQLKTYLIFFIFLNSTLHATNEHLKTYADPKVNIELSNIATNGLLLPNNTINFNGVEDLEIEFDVKTSYTGTNAKYLDGLLNCYYYEPNAFDNEIAQYYNNGVTPQYLFQKNEKLEYKNGIYTYTYRQKLRFKRSTAFNTGCSIVFRYRAGTLTTDISNKLTYKITGGTKTGNEPSKPSTANINLTSISYSDGSPLINNQIIVPTFKNHETKTTEIGIREIDLSFNFNCTYGSKMYLGYYPGVQIQIADNASVRAYLTEFTTPIVTNGTLTFKNLKIKASDLSPTSYLKIRFTFQEVQINLNCAIVRSSRPIIYNTISDNQSISVGSKSKPLIGTIAKASLSPIFTYYTTDITKYQWQQKIGDNKWTNIIGATLQNYTPVNIFNVTTSFRRIAINSEGLLDYSEYITISTIAPLVNNICCNQNLPYRSSQPSIFTGNISESSASYQWQISQKPLEWVNIPNANNQNHNFIFTFFDGNPGNVNSSESSILDASFRRLIIKNEAIISVSNNILVTRLDRQDRSIIEKPTTPIRIDAKGRRFSTRTMQSEQSEQFEINNLTIYPNPIINNFFIEGPVNINDINIYDSFGAKFNIEKFQKSNDLIEVNSSRLQSGIFILKVDNTTYSKTLIKN